MGIIITVSQCKALACLPVLLTPQIKQQNHKRQLGVVAHAFNSLGGRYWQISQFEDILVHIVSSRPAGATSKNKQTKPPQIFISLLQIYYKM